AGLALFGGIGAPLRRGARQKDLDRLRRRGRGLAVRRMLIDGDGIAGLGGLLRSENGARRDVQRDDEKAGAKDGAEHFVEFERVHRKSAPQRDEGAEEAPAWGWP